MNRHGANLFVITNVKVEFFKYMLSCSVSIQYWLIALKKVCLCNLCN